MMSRFIFVEDLIKRKHASIKLKGPQDGYLRDSVSHGSFYRFISVNRDKISPGTTAPEKPTRFPNLSNSNL